MNGNDYLYKRGWKSGHKQSRKQVTIIFNRNKGFPFELVVKDVNKEIELPNSSGLELRFIYSIFYSLTSTSFTWSSDPYVKELLSAKMMLEVLEGKEQERFHAIHVIIAKNMALEERNTVLILFQLTAPNSILYNFGP